MMDYCPVMQTNGELPMKIVGRSQPPRVNVETFDSMQRMANTLRAGKPFVPKGVWRFHSFTEADQWLMKMLTRPRNPASRS